MNNLWDYVGELTADLEDQLLSDQERQVDYWKRQPREGQEDRIYGRLLSYWTNYKQRGEPIPWMKIIGLCLIALIREGKYGAYTQAEFEGEGLS